MSEIHELEQHLKSAKEMVAQNKEFELLLQNKQFRELILDGFCKDEAARYVQLSVDTNMSEEGRRDALGMAQAAGYLMRWLQVRQTMANMAERQIPEIEAELAELRAEGYED